MSEIKTAEAQMEDYLRFHRRAFNTFSIHHWTMYSQLQSQEIAELRAAYEAQRNEVERLQKENEGLKEDLQFVERWANHHGTKPNVTAQEALSCIQHYPSIAAITKSYEDGVIPTTRNPYAEIESLRKQVEILQRPLDDQIISRIVCLVKNIPDEELASNVFESVRNMTNWNKSTPAEFLVLFDKTAASKNGE